MRLRREERTKLLHGGAPRLVRDKKPPCERGDVLEVGSGLEIIVESCKRTKAGEWRVGYRIRDFRGRYPRSVPPVFEPPELDDEGRPIPPTDDAIKEARLDGSYTSTMHGAVPDVGHEVDDETLTKFTKEARLREAGRRDAEEVARKQARQFSAKVREAAIQVARNGGDPGLVFARVDKMLFDNGEMEKAA